MLSGLLWELGSFIFRPLGPTIGANLGINFLRLRTSSEPTRNTWSCRSKLGIDQVGIYHVLTRNRPKKGRSRKNPIEIRLFSENLKEDYTHSAYNAGGFPKRSNLTKQTTHLGGYPDGDM